MVLVIMLKESWLYLQQVAADRSQHQHGDDHPVGETSYINILSLLTYL